MIAQIKLDGEQYTRVSVIYEEQTGYNDLESLKSSLFFLLNFVSDDVALTSKDLAPVVHLLENLQLTEEQQNAISNYFRGEKSTPHTTTATIIA